MLRRALILVVACGCELPTPADPAIDLRFPEAEQSGEIPFRIGGPFTVQVFATTADLGASARVAVEIVTDAAPADAVVSTTVALVEQSNGQLVGTGVLKWPRGGPLRVRTVVGDVTDTWVVPLEASTITVTPVGGLSFDGARTVQDVCVQSSSTDGSVFLVADGARLESGTTSGTLALAPGVCNGVYDPRNPSSTARARLIVQASEITLRASLIGSDAFASHVIAPGGPVTPGALTVDLAAPTTTPPPLSIVDVTIDVFDGTTPLEGVAVHLRTLPSSVEIVPAVAATDANGRATASFQMPAAGPVRVTASVGDASDTIERVGP